jgi:hypothetical protein
MPSVSKKQQQFFGLVDAYMSGKLKNPSKKVKDAAKSMSKKEVKMFAKTKRKGLPEKVKKKKTKKKSSDNIFSSMIKLANHLDHKGFTKEADLLDQIIFGLTNLA